MPALALFLWLCGSFKLQEALGILATTPPDAWVSLEDFEAELDRAEAAGEVSR